MKKLFALILAACMLLGSVAFAETWTCQQCGALNEHNFCGDCGAKKSDEWTCSGCGSVNKSKFCPDCGMARDNNQPQAPQVTAAPAPAEAQVQVTPRVEFYRADSESKVHSAYENVIYAGDYDEQISYHAGCRINNNSDAAYVAKLTVELDGENYSFADREIAANDDHGFVVDSVKLSVGEHHVKWFLDGVLAAETSITVKEGNSDNYKWIQENLNTSVALCVWDTSAKRRVENGLVFGEISKLKENQKYIPHLAVTNKNAMSTPMMTVAFFLDGDVWRWEDEVLGADETMNYVHSAYEHKIGVSEIVMYINAIRVNSNMFALLQ